jgi:DNA-binding transcriptional regulator YdaS (Cro superfamily)
MRTETARALLALRPGPDLAHDHCSVDGTGLRRRMRSLVARGFPQAYLAERLGVTESTLSRDLRGGRVTAATHRAGRALYDQLWDQDPAHHGIAPHKATRARLAAQRRGWHLPLAWDDDTIDDPATLPDLGAHTTREQALAEDAVFVARTAGGDRKAIAERLGITRDYLDAALARTGTAIPTLQGAAA